MIKKDCSAELRVFCAKGQTIWFQYDALNRLRQKDYGTQKTLGSGDVVYTYDAATSNGVGRLTNVTDPSGSSTFYYDAMGRLTQTNKVVDGNTYTTKTQYDYAGRVLDIAYPDDPGTYSPGIPPRAGIMNTTPTGT